MTEYEVTTESVSLQLELVKCSNESTIKEMINNIPYNQLRNILYNMTLAARTGRDYEEKYDEIWDALNIFKKALNEI